MNQSHNELTRLAIHAHFYASKAALSKFDASKHNPMAINNCVQGNVMYYINKIMYSITRIL